ncbi:hypothetical protein ADUPG1_009167 [Aduncisulcus paluster]|uniref:Uncharacterized protein n=1 Tax=Aduncisulcus paluster TaxID=2918883 RepID=A0ABQ5KUQ4_9EUKA|nr:hypothetical protein ADUPG1_009167 [Aduncisulcus paluster]
MHVLVVLVPHGIAFFAHFGIVPNLMNQKSGN